MSFGQNAGQVAEQMSLLHAEDAETDGLVTSHGSHPQVASAREAAPESSCARTPRLSSAPGLPQVTRFVMCATAVLAVTVLYREAWLAPLRHHGNSVVAPRGMLIEQHVQVANKTNVTQMVAKTTGLVVVHKVEKVLGGTDDNGDDDAADDTSDNSEGSTSCAKIGCGKAYVKSLTCQCNEDCWKYNDCCDDYEAKCQKDTAEDEAAEGDNASCLTVDPEKGGVCWGEVLWVITDGLGAHPDWYPGLDKHSSLEQLQEKVHKASPTKCPKAPCPGHTPVPKLAPPHHQEEECKPRTEGKCEAPRIMGHAGASSPLSCMCPPPLVPHKNTSCNNCHSADGPQLMTFYMYRAQDDNSYPIENVNLADLAGVMWYLHREVVGSTPRKFKIQRIMRFSVSIKTTQPFYDHFPKQFGPFVAYDAGSAKGRSDIWKKYGFVVGCQLLDSKLFNYVPLNGTSPACRPKDSHTCTSPKWYSLPGPCPESTHGHKTEACESQWPGGACSSAVVTGDRDCTYFAAPAGEISLDELEGIKAYKNFWIGVNATTGDRTPNGNVEYDFKKDAGIGMDFWDGRHDLANCTRRMERVTKLFKKKYPNLPETLPEPPCT